VRAAEAAGVSSFIADCEIVPVAHADGAPAAEPGVDDASTAGPTQLSFQTLGSRKRAHVTLENASAETRVLTVCFDLLQLNGTTLLSHTYAQRRQLLRRTFPRSLPSHGAEAAADGAADFALAVQCDVLLGVAGEAPSAALGRAEEEVRAFFEHALLCGSEGLMCKRHVSQYAPDSLLRSDAWCKLKKDYLEGLGDSLDLVPIGGWRGDGRKGAWVSPFLLACWNPETQTFQSVCRVMSGFTDQSYRENTLLYTGVENVAQLVRPEGKEGGEGEAPVGRRVCEKPEEYETGETCQWWFAHDAEQPLEVWEVRGAELSISPVHGAALGLVDSQRGLSLRFPRFLRKRADKGLEGVTTAAQLADMYSSQGRQQTAQGIKAAASKAKAAKAKASSQALDADDDLAQSNDDSHDTLPSQLDPVEDLDDD